MTKRRLIAVGVVLVVLVASVRLAITPTFLHGYTMIDDLDIAVQVTGARPTWRAVTALSETATEVRIGISEISVQIGSGFGDERIGYVIVALSDPLGSRSVVDATTGAVIPQLAP